MENKQIIPEKVKEALINYLSGNFNKSDSELLNSWLDEDPKNKLLFDQLNDIWQASHYTKIGTKIDVHAAWDDLQKQFHQKKESSL